MMNPRKALADWLDQRAAARAAQKKAAPPIPVPAEAIEPEMIAQAEDYEGEIISVTEAPADIRQVVRRALERRPVIEPLGEFDLPGSNPVPAAPEAPGGRINWPRPEFEAPAEVAEEPSAPPASEAEAAAQPAVPASEPFAETAPSAIEIDTEALQRLELGFAPSTVPGPSMAELWRAMGAPVAPPKPPKSQPAPPRLELIQGAAALSPDAPLPAGMHDEAILRRAISTGKRFSGFILAIGVTDSKGRVSDKDLLRSIETFIAGMLTEDEFGCRRGDDEFLILCPEQHGATTQLRLRALSEKLWDYQLRGAARFSLIFTWGSAEIHQESIADGVAEATERLYETQRTRRLVSIDMLSSQPRCAAI